MSIELASGEQKQLKIAMSPIVLPGGLQIERFFVVNIPIAEDGEFEVHCHIKNIGQGLATGQVHLIGEIFIGGGELIREVDKLATFTIAANEIYDYKWKWHSMKNDNAWLQVIGDWGEQTPRLDFIVGYMGYDPATKVELVCTSSGSNYAILRYSQKSICEYWNFSCWTPPLGSREQEIQYPILRLSPGWASISHAMLGLLPSREYRGRCWGGQPDRQAYTTFNTQF